MYYLSSNSLFILLGLNRERINKLQLKNTVLCFKKTARRRSRVGRCKSFTSVSKDLIN